jgi:cysteine desulfurase
MRLPVYLDHHASTPPDPRVLAKMREALEVHFGTPASATHAYGWAAASLVEAAREEVARLIGATPREIVFTSGATEANNLALKGFAAARAGAPGHLVTSAFEHEAVQGPLAELAARGWRVSAVPAGADGVVDPAAVAAALAADTALVSVMSAQNEIGTLQPVREIGALCRARGIAFHTDAAQAAGKVPLDVESDAIDLLSLSGHKLYAPQGVGALYVRRRAPRITLAPLLTGGGQERGLRAGTLNVPGIVALGEACRLARDGMEAEGERLRELAARLLSRVRDRLPGVRLNGHAGRRLPGSLSLSFAGLPPRRLLAAVPTLAVSSGAACASGEQEPSPVLLALGLPRELALATVRLALGRGTTTAEVDYAAGILAEAGTRLREEGRQAGLTAPPPV